MPKVLLWFLKGAAMGAANVIPGVSGGTIAFITGIYERLINALKALDLRALRLLFTFDLRTFAIKIDFAFLAAIFGGIGLSIMTLARLLEWAFLNHETLTLAFFFGLIAASVIGVGRQISRWDIPVSVAFVSGTVIALGVAFLPPAAPNDSLIYLGICGVAAICSMILPGLSGSYVMLLLGNYVLVLNAVSTMNFGILMPVMIGCIAGLVLFSRLLGYLFSHFKDQTIGMLTGFVVGSLLIIWPWKATIYQDLSPGRMKAVGYDWLLPDLDVHFLLALGCMLVGFIGVWMIDRAGATD